MSTSGTGCTTATCAQPSPGACPVARETTPLLAVALLGAFAAGTLVATVANLAATRPEPFAVLAAASDTAGSLARRELVAELGRSVIDPARFASLAATVGMSNEESIGALRLALRAAIRGGAARKARELGMVIAQLQSHEAGR